MCVWGTPASRRMVRAIRCWQRSEFTDHSRAHRNDGQLSVRNNQPDGVFGNSAKVRSMTEDRVIATITGDRTTLHPRRAGGSQGRSGDSR